MSVVKSRREQYSEATRTALLETATAQFVERGFDATTLEGVASATQVTRGAVYHHFSNKRALFQAAFEAMEEHMIEQVSAAVEQARTPLEAADIAIVAFLDKCCDPVYSRLSWQEGPVALGLQAWKICEEQYAYGLIEQLLRALVDSGDIAPLPLATAGRFAFALLGAAGMELAEADEADKPQVKAECVDMLRRFLASLRPTASEPQE